MEGKYYKDKKTVDEYIKMAEGINGKQLIDSLKTYLKPGAKLLEIGSGPGSDFSILKKDFQVTGSDYSLEFLKHLKNAFKNDVFLHLDAGSLETNQKFEGIYSNKVLQHLTNKELAISIVKQTEILQDEGIICHSFWKGEEEEIFNGLFVNYQSARSLRELFEKYFKVLVLKEYKEFEDGDSILLIGKKL